MPTTYETRSAPPKSALDEIRAAASKWARVAGGLLIGIILLVVAGKLWFTVTNSEVVALTYPNGHVDFFTSPGIYGQYLGHTTGFEKRKKYDFEEHIQFNDGAHATIKGSVQYQVPLDKPSLYRLYALYPSEDSIQSGLIETNLQKAVYLTGRTMSSKESYAERRGDLLSYMEDQLKHGPYQTKQYTKEIPDDLDKTKTKIINVVDIAVLPNGQPQRQEPGLMEQYNIDTSNFNFSVTYDPEVEKQIQSMQQQSQAVNQKIAEAKMAEQNVITIAKNGEASAAQAKWAQEKLNAGFIAESQMRVTVAEQDRQAALLKKQQLILEGEGEAQKRQLIMNADGALAQKLTAWLEGQKVWASAYEHGPAVVPQIQSGSQGGGNGGIGFMEMMGAKAAKDLSLDMSVTGGRKK